MATYVSLSDFANATMSEWQKNVPNIVNMKYWLRNNIKAKTITQTGEDVYYIPFQTKGLVSAMESGENVANPTPVSPAHAKLSLYNKKIVARMIVSEETLTLGAGKNALASSLTRLMDSTLADYNMHQRVCHAPARRRRCVRFCRGRYQHYG